MQYALSLTRHLASLSTRHVTRLCCRSQTPRRHLLTLAIETSCDDTCVAIVEYKSRSHGSDHHIPTVSLGRDGEPTASSERAPAQLYFNEKITAKNTGLGGIVPVQAMQSHLHNLAKLVDRAVSCLPVSENTADHSKNIVCRDGSVRRKPDFVSVTRGPGMLANLTCGVETAKGLAVAWQVPLLGVHHMQAHALTARFVHALEPTQPSHLRPEFPFLTLLVSGGHTILLYSTALTEHKILVTSSDVAIGDALDKCGRLLLSEETKANAPDTSFGKYLSQYAFPDQTSFEAWPIPRRRKDEIDKPANRFGWQLSTPLRETRDLRFSFGALAGSVQLILEERKTILQGSSSDERLLLARTAIGTAFEHLGSRTVIALEDLRRQGINIRNLVVSGGVASNDFLRYYLRSFLTIRGFEDVNLVWPPVKYCTDNAAMIAWTGIEMYQAGYSSDLGISSIRKWSMDANADDGGILGVGGWYHHATSFLPERLHKKDAGSGEL